MASSLESVSLQFLAMGLPPIPAHEIKVDAGRFTRYGPGKKAYYKVVSFTTGSGKLIYVGHFGHKGDGPWKIEQDGDQALTDDELAEMKQKQEALARRDAERRARDAERAANRAKMQIEAASKSGESEYLKRKLVQQPESVRFMAEANWAGWIILPLLRYDESPARIVGSQKISPIGEKRFNAGMAKEGAACRLGKEPADGDPILIGEGYATCASVRQALDFSCAAYVALDAENLKHVAKIVRGRFPASPIVFVADDDYLTGEPGRLKAEIAAQNVGNARVLLPRFAVPRAAIKDDPNAPYLTDFNDLHCAEGVEAVARQVREFVLSAALPIAASPAPAIPAGDAFANGDAGGEASSRSLAYLLAHCRFIAGKRDVWDDQENVKYSWSSIRLEFGDAAVKEWAAHADRRKNIPESAVRAAESKEKSGGLLDRLRLIVGGLQKEVWDNQRRSRLPLGVVEAEFPNEFEMWHKSPARSRYDIEYANIVFDPTEMVDPDLFVNTFKGLPVAPNPVNAEAKADTILKLVLHLCNKNQEQARWMLQWLAFPLIHKFQKKHGSALLVHSNIHGSGKSLLFERIYSEIFGEYSVTAGSRELESQYTGWRSGKLYCLFEEVLTPKEKLQQAGNIKHMITANKVLVSEKFISTWEEANHMAVTFLSNELRPLPVEPYDRRLFVVWPESKLLTEEEAESQDVLVTVEMVLQCIDNGGIEAFHSVLLNMDMTGFDSYRPPMTPAKERLIRHGRSSAETFVALWSSSSLDYAPFCSCTTPQLVAAYKYFCQQMNLHASGGSTLALHAEAFPGVVMHDRKWWRFVMATRQQPMYVVGRKPENVYAEMDWLGESQEQFRVAWSKFGPNVN